MGKFNTRNGLSSLANSDITGQFSIYGGGASVPLLIDGATNRLLTLSDTNSGSVFEIADADGGALFDVSTTGITVGGNYTLPLTDGTANQYLSTDGAGAVTWEDLPTTGITTVEVHNNTGSTLSKGAPVYVTGTHTSGKPTVALTDADGTGTYPAIGLVSADIASGADGTVVAGGTLANWDTSAYTAGDALYIDTTAGALTATRPTAETSKVQKVAMVTRSHATSGSVVVMGAGRTNDIPNDVSLLDLADTPSTYGTANKYLKSTGSGFTLAYPLNDAVLTDISDVQLSSLSSGALDGMYLRYDSVNSEWIGDGAFSGFHAARQLGTITKGTPVRRTGSGNSGALYEMGVGATDNNSRCVGLAFNAADASSRLIVITDGIIGGIDTSSWSADDILYVSNTTGELTNTEPTSGLYVQRVARVISSNATTGSIQVTVDPAFDETTYLENVTNEAIGSLSNVNVSGAISGNILRYDGTNWVDTTLTIPSSATVSAGTTEVLKFTTSNTGTIAELGLDELNRVDLSTVAPTTNDVLQYDGTNWVPAALSSSTAMEDISNTSITPADLVPGNFLLYSATGSGGVWYPANYTLPTSDGSDWQVLTARDIGNTYNDAEWQTLTLTRLGDVNTTGVANGDTLVYNSTSGNFEPGTAGGSQTLDEVLTEGNISTLDAQVGGMTVSQSDNSSSYIAINSIADGTDWPALAITSTSASPADNDYIGSLKWFGQNDAAENVNYAKIDVQTRDVTDATEDGTMNISLMSEGTLTEVLELRGNVAVSRVNLDVVGTVETQTTGLSRAFEAITTDGTGGEWPAVAVSRYTSSPADNDSIGTFSFNHTNSVLGLKTFASVEAIALDVTDSTEDGKLVFNIIEDGTSTQKLEVTSAGATIDGTAAADTFSLSTSDDTGQYYASRAISVSTDWNAFEAFRDDFTYSAGPIGSQAFSAYNDADEVIRYARATGVIADSTDGSEDGQWRWYTMVAGTDTKLMQLDADGLQLGGASGFVLPLTDGTANQVLQTDGSGNVSWATAGGSVSAINDLSDVVISSPSGNQVLVYDQVQTRWENGSIPVPTLAEVTATGASTTTTLTVAQVLQTGTHINVAASGNFSTQLRAKTLEVGASTASISYTFPANDGTDGQVLTTDGSGTLTFETPHYRTWQVFGNHQLTTSNETNYRFMGHTSYGQNYGLFNLSAASMTSFPLAFAQYAEKTGHFINDAGTYSITLDIVTSVSSSTSNAASASEYLGATYTFEVYKATRSSSSSNATFTLLDDVDVTFNSTDTRRHVTGTVTFTAGLSADTFLCVIGKGTTSQGVTRYLQTNYNLSLYKQP